MSQTPSFEQLPGSHQQLVLMAILRLKGRAFAPAIAKEIQFRTGRPTSANSVTNTLTRLEERGWVRSWLAVRNATGGPLVRRYDVVREGWHALQLALYASDCMRGTLPGLDRPIDRTKQRRRDCWPGLPFMNY